MMMTRAVPLRSGRVTSNEDSGVGRLIAMSVGGDLVKPAAPGGRADREDES